MTMNNTKKDEILSIIEELKSNPVEKTGHIYHPLPFKEFDSLKTSSKTKSAYRKWHLIVSALPLQNFDSARVLDVGANAGFYSYQFAKLGAAVDAYEPTVRYAELGDRVAQIYDLSIKWHSTALTSQILSPEKKYDVALMLSVFQWMSQGNALLHEAKNTLQRIGQSSRYLFFELGCNYGKSSINVDGNSLLWVRRLLQENTNYTKFAYLGSVRAWGFKGVRYLFVCSSETVTLNSWQRMATKIIDKIV